MSEFIHAIVQFAEMHAALVYGLAFLVACLESVAVVGVLIPGSGIIVAFGALVPSGAVGFWWLCFWSILGALAGDGLSYWVGHRYHGRLRRLWPLRRHPEVLAHGERFFAAHGGKSVFLSRFVPPVRGTVPLVAGMTGMAPGRFFTSSSLSAFGWAPSHILPGALIGAGLTLTGLVAARLLVFVVVLAAVLWLVVRVTVLTLRHGGRLLTLAQKRVERWARSHPGWVARQLLALLEPSRGEARALALLGLLLGLAAWTFFSVLEDVVSGEPLVDADTAIYNMLQGLRSLVADRVMIAITELGSATVAGAVVAVVALWLIWRRAWHAAAYWVAAVGGASLIGLVIKVALHRPRPAPVSAGWDAFSFPSGHATTSAAIYGFLAILLARDARPAWQAVIAATAALVVALISFSRLYLGAHWFSDVIGGVAFGTAWIALLAIAYVRHNPPQLPAVPLAVILVGTITAVGSFQVAHTMSADLDRYAVRQTGQTMTAATWWRDGWREIPSRRIDLAGEREEPLVLQWAGGRDDLERRLTAAGWRLPTPWSMATAVSWLSQTEDPLTLPVLPRLHDGHPAALTLIHAGSGDHPNGRWVLRVWKSETRLTAPGSKPQALWVGAITQQRIRQALAPFGLGFERSPAAPPWALLEQALPNARRAIWADGGTGAEVMLARDPAFWSLSRGFPRARYFS